MEYGAPANMLGGAPYSIGAINLSPEPRMRKTADVVVIGGGIIGASILYHLAELGVKRAVLVEKSALASGSTGDSAAIVRQHYSNEVSVRLVRRSVEIFQTFEERFGHKVFSNTGWLFLTPPEAESAFHDNLPRLKALGVRTWEVPVEEARKMLPGLNPEGIAHVAYEPDSGYADPHATVLGFVDKAHAMGAEVYVNTPATGLKMSGQKVTGVVTNKGEIAAGAVVNAAGPWAKQVGAWAGLDLPLEISREQEILVQPAPGTPLMGMAVSNMVDRFYMRPQKGGTILVGVGHPKENEPADPDTYTKKATPGFIEDAAGRLSHRLPHMATATVKSGWAGLYTITPDWNMIVDRAPGVDGLYLAVGGSGHSFKLGPAIGQCLAETIVHGKAKTVDITALRATRFAEKAALRSTYGGNRG
ncbi:MAG: FAD-binding oxidoreductase [SAR202 cluster bacterium]|nr:FAD-binding oxidoreductase [SAR202 cluster bacterium]